MNIELIETGTARHYEHYHYDVCCGDVLIGTANFDSNQDKYICDAKWGDHKKRFYRTTGEGIKIAIQEWITKLDPKGKK